MWWPAVTPSPATAVPQSVIVAFDAVPMLLLVLLVIDVAASAAHARDMFSASSPWPAKQLKNVINKWTSSKTDDKQQQKTNID